ncbi:hypothetical protein WJX79_002882 [Trebouxia sp. C0005]
MQRPEDTSRIKRGKNEDRFYCPYPGCTRSFAELWRLKVHYRAPPDVRGSGKERGHGTELQFCPKCGKELKPGKHHVGCFAGRAGPRQPVKRAREVEADVESKDDHAELSTESARQRTRTGVLPDVKFEDVIPRAGSLNQFSEEAASLTRSGWHGEHAAPEAVPLVQDLQTQAQQRSAESELLDTKSTDQFLKYQQMLPSLRRPSRSLLGLPSGPSPPPSPPGGLDPELTNIPPLFDFNLFNPERARGKNARLPVAVTSTLHSPSDAADDMGPSFPHSAPLYSSNHFPLPPQNLPNSLGDVMSRERTLATLLRQPNQLQRPYTPGNLQSLLPWDFNRWGGLPTDVEANVAQGFRLREQQQQQQQQQQAQQQAQHQQHLQQQHSRLLRQEGSERQAVLPWGIQESGLFDAMGGISPEPSAHFGNSAPDMCMSLPMHGRYSGEQLQSGPLSRVQSPELQSGHNSFSDWSQPTGRGLLERVVLMDLANAAVLAIRTDG